MGSFGLQRNTGPLAVCESSTRSADENLLYGVLALEMGFISRDQWVTATSAWMQSKSQCLDGILSEQGAITQDDHDLLQTLVQKHIAGTESNAERTLPLVRSPKESHLHPAPDPATKSRYQLLRPHARGGLGQVWIAFDEELGREVALKEIQPRFARDPICQSRFVQEAEITGRLEHPGVVPVYGLETHSDGRAWYAMRFINGESLREAAARQHCQLDAEHMFELRKLLRRFIDVCNVIEYAHSRGVLHRDLKPDNIMLGKYGETLVVDWGLAVSIGRQGQSTTNGEVTLVPGLPGVTGARNEVVGTPAYMSPEQALGQIKRMSPASDVYSLGATLYTVLTGRTPPVGEARGRGFAARAIKPSIPLPLDAICRKATAAAPADRYASARALADDIERWLADEPVSAYQEKAWQRARRWTRRNRAKSGGLATLLTTLIILGVSWIAQAGRAEQQSLVHVRHATHIGESAVQNGDVLDGLQHFAKAATLDPEAGRACPAVEWVTKPTFANVRTST